jgi:energy-converting hydrogenase Eha subunit C
MGNLPLQSIIAILTGILILLRPEFLNYVVAIYLIIIGILGLIGSRRSFVVSFAMGVVSGVPMSYQFGTNWSRFSIAAGNVAGPLLSYEVLMAFFLEASFLGVVLFGWNRVLLGPWHFHLPVSGAGRPYDLGRGRSAAGANFQLDRGAAVPALNLRLCRLRLLDLPRQSHRGRRLSLSPQTHPWNLTEERRF